MIEILRCTVNNKPVEIGIDPRESLADTLREKLGLTSVKKGCEVGECGACTVLVDGEAIDSCIYLSVWAQGKTILTVEGLQDPDGGLSPIQRAFVEEAAVQCGFCTPGIIMSATPGTSCASSSPATCAAAPATRTSSTPWSGPSTRPISSWGNNLPMGDPPRGRLRGGRPHFFPKKWGERRAGGLRPPWPPSTGAVGGGALYRQGRNRACINARFLFGFEAGAAAPWAARIGITLQTLWVAALYRPGPPGRRRCLAAEIPRRLCRLASGASGGWSPPGW